MFSPRIAVSKTHWARISDRALDDLVVDEKLPHTNSEGEGG